MVLEQLYPVDFLRRHPVYSFLLGIGYTIFAMAFSLILFSQDPALVVVGVASLLLLPSLYQLLKCRQYNGRETPKLFFWNVITDNFPFYKVYIYIFFGCFLMFALFSIILPVLASNHLFQQQLGVLTGGAASGGATWSWVLFEDLFYNNLGVLILCFVISLVAGNGAIFMIVWNASVWGTIFGMLAKGVAEYLQANSAIIFGLIFVSVFPHVLLEISSYIIAVISGTLLSDALAREKIVSKSFGKIFLHNLVLFGLAVLVLLIAVTVETYVLKNFTTYRFILQLGKIA